MTTKLGWGKPKYGKKTGFQKTGKPDTGDNFIRILPPMHTLAEAQEWCKYYSTHWGFAGVNPSDPSKQAMRPFRCIEVSDRRTRMVTQECPACERYKATQQKAEDQESALKASGKSAEEIETAMTPIRDWLKAFKVERKWYVNVMYKDGHFGDYKLNHKIHMNALRAYTEGNDTTKSLLEAEGIDPLALDQGVWFNIKRVGNGFAQPDTIEVEQETIDAEVNGKKVKVKQILQAPLTDEQADRALKECRDLAKLGGLTLSYDQVLKLVECNGDPEEVDRIIGGSKREESAKAAPAAPTPAPANDNTRKEQALKEAIDAAASTEETAAIAKAAMVARAAEIRAKKAAEAAALKAAEEAKAAAQAAEAAKAKAATPATAPAPTANPIDMSDDDFLKFFESGAGA